METALGRADQAQPSEEDTRHRGERLRHELAEIRALEALVMPLGERVT